MVNLCASFLKYVKTTTTPLTFLVHIKIDFIMTFFIILFDPTMSQTHNSFHIFVYNIRISVMDIYIWFIFKAIYRQQKKKKYFTYFRICLSYSYVALSQPKLEYLNWLWLRLSGSSCHP